MLLTAINKRLRDDAGFAMASVLALMLVGVLITTLILSTTISAIGQTTATRAGVQSQASAEAGVAAARAGLIAGNCSAKAGVYQSAVGATPAYKAIITVPQGSGWTTAATCPVSLSLPVRIISTGFAESNGIGTQTTGNKTSLEVILAAAVSPTSIVATGPAIYANNSEGFGGGGKLFSEGGSTPNVLVKEGNVVCDGGAGGASDIVVDNGNLRIDNGCNITGNAWATGAVTIPGGANVGGNVVASSFNSSGSGTVAGSVWVSGDIYMSGGAGINGNASAANVTISNGPKINGTVVATNAVRLEGGGSRIGGNVSASSLTFTSSGTVGTNAWIQGNTFFEWGSSIGGSLRTKTVTQQDRGSVSGGVAVVPAGPGASPYLTNGATPVRPIVPNWVDFNYNQSDWTGFGSIAISGGVCGPVQVQNAINMFAGQPGVVDARGCTGGIKADGGAVNVLQLSGDVAIIANRFDFSGSAGFNSGSNVRLWLITPDTVSGDGPTCPPASTSIVGGGYFSISGGATFSSRVKMMIYTPCRVLLGSSTEFYGQVFSGKAGIDGGAKLHYVAVGLPGVDLNTGATSTSTATEANRVISSVRTVSAGN